MSYLIISILFSVLLLVNFRLFPKFGINTTHAISLNYIICFLTGLALMPAGQSFTLDFSERWVIYCLALGVGFILTFILSGMATQQAGMTATSLANNLSLVIPVLANLLFFPSQNTFKFINYLGLILAFVALFLVTIKPNEKLTVRSSGSWLLIAVFLMYGLTNTAINFLNLKYIPNPERTIPVTLVMVLGAAVSGILLLAYRLAIKKEAFSAKTLIGSVTLGVPNFLSFYFLLLALTAFANSGALVYPIYNIGVIVLAALIGIIFFKEKLSTTNYIGLGIALLSIILISA